MAARAFAARATPVRGSVVHTNRGDSRHPRRIPPRERRVPQPPTGRLRPVVKDQTPGARLRVAASSFQGGRRPRPSRAGTRSRGPRGAGIVPFFLAKNPQPSPRSGPPPVCPAPRALGRGEFDAGSLPESRQGRGPPPLHQSRPRIGRDHPLNLSISLSGGKETNQDSLSSGE